MTGPSASDVNRTFYEGALPGRDAYWRKMAAPRARVRELLSLVRELGPARIIDLGSGGGQLLAELEASLPGAELAGIDLAEAQIEANRRLLPKVSFQVADLGSRGVVPEALRASFDAVIASEIIEHVDDPEALLANAFDLARPSGGHLILSTQSGKVRETERRVGHRRHFSRAEMQIALRRTGWTALRVWNAGFPFHDASKWYANLNPAASMTRFADKPYGLYEDLVCLALRAAFRFNSRSRGAQLYAVARRGREPTPGVTGRSP